MKPFFLTGKSIWLPLFIGLFGMSSLTKAQTINADLVSEQPSSVLTESVAPIVTPGNSGPTAERRNQRAVRRQDIMIPTIGRLFPNPTHDQLFVELNAEGQDAVQVALYDALGRFVRLFSLHPGLTHLSLSGLPAGSYTLRTADHWARVVVE